MDDKCEDAIKIIFLLSITKSELTVQEIAKGTHISNALVQQLVLKLQEAEILIASKQEKNSFHLPKNALNISALDIFNAVSKHN